VISFVLSEQFLDTAKVTRGIVTPKNGHAAMNDYLYMKIKTP